MFTLFCERELSDFVSPAFRFTWLELADARTSVAELESLRDRTRQFVLVSSDLVEMCDEASGSRPELDVAPRFPEDMRCTPGPPRLFLLRGSLPVRHAIHELQSGPVLVHGADFDVHDSRREPRFSDDVAG